MPRIDWFGLYRDFGDEFRADNGFVPQVGFRRTYGEGGYTVRPTGFVRRIRIFFQADYEAERDGSLIFREISPGVGMDARWNSFIRLRPAFDKVRAGSRTFDRNQFLYIVEGSPSRVINRVGINGSVGDEVDFANSRAGDGGNVNAFATIRPTDHLELRVSGARRWLDVDAQDGRGGRLFTAHVARLRGQYTFSARMDASGRD